MKKSTVPSFSTIAKDFHSPLVRNEIWVNFCYLWPQLFDLPRPEVDIYSKENAITYVANLESWKKAKETFQKRVEQKPTILADVIAQSEAWGKEMNEFTRQVHTDDLSLWSGEELVKFYEHFAQLQSREYAVGILLPLLDIAGVSFLEDFLRSYLKRRFTPAEAGQAFGILTTPTKNSFALDQEAALLDLATDAFADQRCREIIANNLPAHIPRVLQEQCPAIAKRLYQHAQEYGWVYYVYAGPAFTEAHFADFLKEYLKKEINPTIELQRRQEERADLLKKRTAFLEQLQPDETSRQLIELVSEFVWAKPRRKDYQSKSYYHLESFFKEYARRMGISLRHARSATQYQIRAGLLGEKIPLSIFEQQYKEHFVYSTDQGAVVCFGKEAEELFANVEQEESTVGATSELQGATAFAGYAKGTVKIINKPEDMNKMQDGDILVSVATTPSIVPAMKKASAIISDEGGLTCHAAIVSRELKIPCVVGTKVATKVLKDGMEVEVDADNGIIKILE